MRYLFILLMLFGCATSSGVVTTGADTYMISGKNTAIGASGHDVSAQLYREAGEFCSGLGKTLVSLEVSAQGPGFGRFPNSRLDFRCEQK